MSNKAQPVEVNYGATTTTMGDDGSEIVLISTLDPDLMVVTPKEDRVTKIGPTWYTIKKNVQQAIPKEVFEELRRCEIIHERKWQKD